MPRKKYHHHNIFTYELLPRKGDVHPLLIKKKYKRQRETVNATNVQQNKIYNQINRPKSAVNV